MTRQVHKFSGHAGEHVLSALLREYVMGRTSNMIVGKSGYSWTSSEGMERVFHVRQRLAGLSGSYPGIDSWFAGKVFPGLVSGSRQIFAEYHGDQPLGFVIAKRGSRERKLCTIWVDPLHRGDGLSVALVSSAIKWLDCSRPVVSASESASFMLAPLFERFKFQQTYRSFGHYTLDSAEYFYNTNFDSSWKN